VSNEIQGYRVGDVEVIRVNELVLTEYAANLVFPEWDPAILDVYRDRITPGMMGEEGRNVIMSVHTWLLKTPQHVILIDTGVGNDKHRPYTPGFDHLHVPFLERLAEAGVRTEDVDYVLLTHLHVDHVGWNTHLVDGRWVPTFPNARYIFSKRELEFFTDDANNDDRNKTSFIVQSDSTLPVVEAGLADLITIDGEEVVDGLAFHSTAGHSIDHASISLTSRGENALFNGDTMHHPIQVYRPEMNSMFDANAEKSRSARRWVLDHVADKDAIMFSTHFPETSAGRVTREAGGYSWRFI
jgi:glyoxylase-like metal-dependent hydrolase (beta-lactamase superfamily II)